MSNRENEMGTLIIVVLKARNLNDKHSLYKQDVFAQVTFNGTTKKTKLAIRGGQHPEWDEELRYPVFKQSGDRFRKVEVACYAKEPRSEDILGKGEVDITDTLRTGEFDDWVPLNIDGVFRGDMYLEMTFYSNGPAPALTPSASYHAAPSSNFQRRPSKLERINRPQADPQLGTPSTRPLQPGRHTSGFLAPDPRHPFEQSVPAQHTPIVPAFGSVTTAALHNLLSDTATGQQPQSNTYLTSKGHHSRSPSPSSSKRVDSPLPTLPRQETLEAGLPSVLLPGSGRPRTPSYTYTAPELPSTLRTRTGRAVSSPTPSQHVPTSSQQTFVGSTGLLAQHNGIAAPNVSNNKAYTLGPTPIILSSRNSHLIPGSTNTPPLFSSDSTAAQPPYGVPVSMTSQWLPEAASTESFSFPVPMLSVPAPGELPSQENYVPPPVQANHTYISPPAGYGPPPPQVDYPSKSGYLQASYPSQPISQHWQQPSFQDRTSDPLLQTRYSTPLPLPPGSGIPPRGQQIGSSVTAANRDQTRLEALRGVENETERRKTQEEMDRELALALDRELNLEGPRG